MTTRLLTDCHVATMAGSAPYGAIEDAAILIADGRIAWVGPRAEAPAAESVERLDGRWVTPGLIDCHTHLVFGGDRSGEFEQRLGGATYEEIARAGGGIVSSVKATRAASEDELYASALTRLAGLKARGWPAVAWKRMMRLPADWRRCRSLRGLGSSARSRRCPARPLRWCRGRVAFWAAPPPAFAPATASR